MIQMFSSSFFELDVPFFINNFIGKIAIDSDFDF